MRLLVPVDSCHISVVIQGPLFRTLGPQRNILSCIASVRKHLPHAEIIVSTWRDEDTSDIDVEHLVLLDDPGGFIDVSGNEINTNRMLYSTQCGIQAATRPYVMKLRADHNLTGNALAVIGQPLSIGSGAVRLFDRPITMTTLYIRDPLKVPMLFHISDLVQFGTRSAMLALWDQPLFEEHEVLNARPCRNPFGNFTGYSSMRMIPEQSVMLGALRQYGVDIRLNNPSQVCSSHLRLWDSLLKHNFRVLDYSRAGVDFPERFISDTRLLKMLYKAAQIEHLGTASPMSERLRRAGIGFNKYITSCLRPVWWRSLAALILFNTSPALARRLRSYWRKARNLVHPGSYRS